MPKKYDFFISYSQEDKRIANYLVEQIEKHSYNCFIAPRNVPSGAEYATVLIKAIESCNMVILLHSRSSDSSRYVRSEINSAVARGKKIIQLRLEPFSMSEAMEFYLGASQWIDAYPELTVAHVNMIIDIYKEQTDGVTSSEAEKTIQVVGPSILTVDEVLNIGYKPEEITMKEIELDFMCVPREKFNMSDEIEGTLGDWISALEYEKDTSCLLIKNDEIIGYCDLYPVKEEAYRELMSGQKMIEENMLDLYVFGGVFDMYIAMLSIHPQYNNQRTYVPIIDWLFHRIASWKNDFIEPRNIGISIYSDVLEEIMIKFGFHFVTYNLARGKVYATDIESLRNNPLVKRRYADLDI